MPLDTDDHPWIDGEYVTESKKDEIINFLKDDPEKAYNTREISDEVFGTEWELAHERKREIQRFGIDEFNQRKEQGVYGSKFDSTEAEAEANSVMDQMQTNRMCTYLDQLLDEGIVEVREVPSDVVDIPFDVGSVPYYSYKDE